MIRIIWDQGFKRVYKKKVKNDDELKKRFWDATPVPYGKADSYSYSVCKGKAGVNEGRIVSSPTIPLPSEERMRGNLNQIKEV